MINGYTRTCGLLGNPVEHTMSPAIHNFLAEKTGCNLAYLPFRVEEGRLEDAVKGAYALNFLGLNVTVPYKREVIPLLQEIDPLAETIGAVNTLVRIKGGFRGYNTDMPGLMRAFISDGVKIAGEKVLILGAGGVARAVAVLLAKEKAEEIVLLNRTVEKAQRIAEEINQMSGRELVKPLSLKDWDALPGERAYLAIQTTDVGMFPEVERAVIEEEAFYRRVHTGYDLIFNPLETRFMQLVRESKGQAYNGLKMLLYQGIIAYELWTDRQIEDELAQQAYDNILRQMECGR